MLQSLIVPRIGGSFTMTVLLDIFWWRFYYSTNKSWNSLYIFAVNSSSQFPQKKALLITYSSLITFLCLCFNLLLKATLESAAYVFFLHAEIVLSKMRCDFLLIILQYDREWGTFEQFLLIGPSCSYRNSQMWKLR